MLLFVQLVMLGAFKPQHKSTDAIVFHINMLALVQKLYLLLHYCQYQQYMYHMCKINSIIVFRKTQSIQSDWGGFVYTAQPFSYIFLHLKNNHHRHQNLKIVTCFINHTNKVLRSVFFLQSKRMLRGGYLENRWGNVFVTTGGAKKRPKEPNVQGSGGRQRLKGVK